MLLLINSFGVLIAFDLMPFSISIFGSFDFIIYLQFVSLLLII